MRAAATSKVVTSDVSAKGVTAAALSSVGSIATMRAAVEASIGEEQRVACCKTAFMWVAAPHVCQSRGQPAPRVEGSFIRSCTYYFFRSRVSVDGDEGLHHEEGRNYSTSAVSATNQQDPRQPFQHRRRRSWQRFSRDSNRCHQREEHQSPEYDRHHPRDLKKKFRQCWQRLSSSKGSDTQSTEEKHHTRNA